MLSIWSWNDCRRLRTPGYDWIRLILFFFHVSIIPPVVPLPKKNEFAPPLWTNNHSGTAGGYRLLFAMFSLHCIGRLRNGITNSEGYWRQRTIWGTNGPGEMEACDHMNADGICGGGEDITI